MPRLPHWAPAPGARSRGRQPPGPPVTNTPKKTGREVQPEMHYRNCPAVRARERFFAIGSPCPGDHAAPQPQRAASSARSSSWIGAHPSLPARVAPPSVSACMRIAHLLSAVAASPAPAAMSPPHRPRSRSPQRAGRSPRLAVWEEPPSIAACALLPAAGSATPQARPPRLRLLRMSRLLNAACVSLLIISATGHGGLTFPPPRNNFNNHNPSNHTPDGSLDTIHAGNGCAGGECFW
jgi:hypothetical protein